MAPTIREILLDGEALLRGVDSPRLSAELIVAEVLGCSRMALLLDRDRLLSEEQEARVRALLRRRVLGEPVAYLIGRKEFYGLDFRVTPDVLIPRPETEHIVEAVEAEYANEGGVRFADLGTGSGILAVTIAYLLPQCSGTAVDLNSGALAVAQNNANAHGVHDRLAFIRGDFTRPLFRADAFDLIVTNPPYVTEQEYRDASHEVTGFEPASALVSGVDGLDHIKSMLPQIVGCLKSGGRLFMEIGWDQAKLIKNIITREFPQFSEVTVRKDLSGHDRVLFLRKG